MKIRILIRIIIILLIAAFLLGGVFYINDLAQRGSDTGDPPSSPDRESPLFGGPSDRAPITPDGTDPDTLRDPDTFGETFIPQLRKLSDMSSGGVFVSGGTDTDQTGRVRFVDRSTGHMFETATNTPTITRISNTTIPRIQRAAWSENGEHVVLQYLRENTDVLETFLASLTLPTAPTPDEEEDSPPSTDIGSTNGFFLPQNADSLALRGEDLFYLLTQDDRARGIVGNMRDQSQATVVFDSPAHEWLASWPNQSTILLTTKPSHTVPGFVFVLNPQTGNFSKLFGGRGFNGLTVHAHPQARSMIYSYANRGRPQLGVYNRLDGSTADAPMRTFAEKCVWSPVEDTAVYCAVPKNLSSGEYPDQWYQGVVSFSDDIWRLDTQTFATELVFGLERAAREAIDVSEIAINEDGTHVLLLNKNNSSLWLLRL